MIAHPVERMSKADFNRWLTALDGVGDRQRSRRYEWVEGRVVQMINTTRNHGRIVRNFLRAFETSLDPHAWEAFVLEFGVEDESYQRYPDVVVEPAGGAGDGRRAENPILIVEVLSSSTAKTDLIDKQAEYLSIATLEAYIVASQEEAVGWLWQRRVDGTFDRTPEEVRGSSAVILLAARGIHVPLVDLYRGTSLT